MEMFFREVLFVKSQAVEEDDEDLDKKQEDEQI